MQAMIQYVLVIAAISGTCSFPGFLIMHHWVPLCTSDQWQGWALAVLSCFCMLPMWRQIHRDIISSWSLLNLMGKQTKSDSPAYWKLWRNCQIYVHLTLHPLWNSRHHTQAVQEISRPGPDHSKSCLAQASLPHHVPLHAMADWRMAVTTVPLWCHSSLAGLAPSLICVYI